MSEDTDVAPGEATEEAVVEKKAARPEGQEKNRPAEAETDDENAPEGENSDDPEAEEKKSASKERRERRKAEYARIRGELEEAKAAEKAAADRLARIQDAAKAAQPPKESDFPDYNDYLIAMAAHQSVAALDKRETSALEEQAAQAKAKAEQIEQLRQRELATAWVEQVNEAKSRYKDYDKVTNDPTIPISQTMGELIMASDVGADVYYHLATNRAEAARISGMEPLEQARAIGAIEARMSFPKARTQSEAPDPINPVTPRGNTTAKRPEEMTPAEYRKWREGR